MYTEIFFHFEKTLPEIAQVSHDLTALSGLNITVKQDKIVGFEGHPFADPNYYIYSPLFGKDIDLSYDSMRHIISISTSLGPYHYLMNMTKFILLKLGGKPIYRPNYREVLDFKVIYRTTRMQPAYLKPWFQMTWWQKFLYKRTPIIQMTGEESEQL